MLGFFDLLPKPHIGGTFGGVDGDHDIRPSDFPPGHLLLATGEKNLQSVGCSNSLDPRREGSITVLQAVAKEDLHGRFYDA